MAAVLGDCVLDRILHWGDSSSNEAWREALLVMTIPGPGCKSHGLEAGTQGLKGAECIAKLREAGNYRQAICRSAVS